MLICTIIKKNKMEQLRQPNIKDYDFDLESDKLTYEFELAKFIFDLKKKIAIKNEQIEQLEFKLKNK